MAGGIPVLPLQASPMAARGRRGLAHHGMSGPRDTAIGHEVSHPSRIQAGIASRPCVFLLSEKSGASERRCQRTLRPPPRTRRVIDMVALLVVGPPATASK